MVDLGSLGVWHGYPLEVGLFLALQLRGMPQASGGQAFPPIWDSTATGQESRTRPLSHFPWVNVIKLHAWLGRSEVRELKPNVGLRRHFWRDTWFQSLESRDYVSVSHSCYWSRPFTEPHCAGIHRPKAAWRSCFALAAFAIGTFSNLLDCFAWGLANCAPPSNLGPSQ